MEEALLALLTGDAGVSALVSDRVFWRRADDANQAARYIVLHRISGLRDMAMSGPSGLVESRVQADCYGARYSDAKLLARAVIDRVSGYRGSVSGFQFRGIFIDSERDDDDDTTGDAETRFRVALDMIIWHAEE